MIKETSKQIRTTLNIKAARVKSDIEFIKATSSELSLTVGGILRIKSTPVGLMSFDEKYKPASIEGVGVKVKIWKDGPPVLIPGATIRAGFGSQRIWGYPYQNKGRKQWILVGPRIANEFGKKHDDIIAKVSAERMAENIITEIEAVLRGY